MPVREIVVRKLIKHFSELVFEGIRQVSVVVGFVNVVVKLRLDLATYFFGIIGGRLLTHIYELINYLTAIVRVEDISREPQKDHDLCGYDQHGNPVINRRVVTDGRVLSTHNS